MEQDKGGRFFREQWIAGVRKYYPGTIKPGYIAPWEEMQGWEQQAAIAVNEQVRAFIRAGYEQGSARLTREQGGRLVSALWNVEVYRNYPEKPKPSYVAPYDELPKWQQETDADIYAAIATWELTARQDTAY